MILPRPRPAGEVDPEHGEGAARATPAACGGLPEGTLPAPANAGAMLTNPLCLALLTTLAQAAPAEEPIVRYDLTPLFGLDLEDPARRREYWDVTHLTSALQGLANRDAARLYVRFNAEADDFWWGVMAEPGGWLAGRPVETIDTVEGLLERFAGSYEGAVVWDERVPATSNLASSIAGAANLLPLRYDADPGSLYQRLAGGDQPRLAVRERLFAEDGGPLFTGTGTIPGTKTASTGSAKCDAYLWLVERYLRTGLLDPHTMGYYLDAYWLQCWKASGPDNCTLTNHDYVIAHKGLLFDLGPWDDETPVDDRGQKLGTDAETLRAILRAAWEQFGGDGTIHVAGFVPWAYKYTNWAQAGGKHEGVPSEWRYAEILSCYNAYMDADALGLSAMANASFYQHHPLPAVVPQNPKPTRESLTARGLLDAEGRIQPKRYYAHYVGDYDSAAWLYRMIPRIWRDTKRGEAPLSWAFNPNLAERFPLGMAWTRATRTPNDFFIAGDSGAGYLNPGNLTEPRQWSGLPSGLAAWEAHCERFYRQWDLSATGFVIDGYAPGVTDETLDAYARFSPDGMVGQKVPLRALHGEMPILRMCSDLPDDPTQAAHMILGGLSSDPPCFAVYRSILKSPSWYVAVRDEVTKLAGDEAECVDLYTLMWLAREYQKDPALQMPPSPYAGAPEVSCMPEASAGLRAVYWADGPFRVEEAAGSEAWVIPHTEPPSYLYLAADDAFYPAPADPLTLTIEYLDAGQGEFAVHYDSTDRTGGGEGAYKGLPLVKRTGSGEWRSVSFRIEDPRLGNSQNGGADMRIYSKGDDLAIRRVGIARE